MVPKHLMKKPKGGQPKMCGKRASDKSLCRCLLPKGHAGQHKCHVCRNHWF
jgi:hypothetical protein